ncbi:uncharacterized protein LOC134059597 [Sardina pilchardus]|uniref:uncharacterized protein LOC134059597 n=1 Tax=Sardina pilchardus TaxID=27697 RepID=UPI002E15855E
MHLPAWDPSVFERAGEVIRQNQQQMSLVLHCHRPAQSLRKDLCCAILSILPHITSLRFTEEDMNEYPKKVFRFLLDLSVAAVVSDSATGESFSELLCSVCTFPFEEIDKHAHYYNGSHNEFLLDLCSRVKDIDISKGRSLLPVLKPFYQTGPAVWTIDLSKTKASLLLEVLKLQPYKKPVELWGWSEEESEVRCFLQCLPYISHLRFTEENMNEYPKEVLRLLLKLSVAAAVSDSATGGNFSELLCSVCTFPFMEIDRRVDYFNGSHHEFLLDLYSCVKDIEIETGRSLLLAIKPFYQSGPAVWTIDLSKTKASLLLEVLKLQPHKKPVELWGWSDEESEVRSFLQCLPYISQLRFIQMQNKDPEDWMKNDERSFHLDLCMQAALCQEEFTYSVVQTLLYLLDISDESNFMFDLYAHVKGIEFETQRKVLKVLHSVYQSVPESWSVDLSERQASLFQEILEFQMEKRPVELTGWSEDESEMRSFLQCLPFISQLSCNPPRTQMQSYEEWIQSVRGFQMDLCQQGLLHEKECGHTGVQRLLSLCSLHDNSDFLLDLYFYMRDCENQTGRKLLSALQKVFLSVPVVWSIDLSEGKISIFLEVLKLQTQKKPVELTGWSDEESEERSFFQCLPYISQLRLNLPGPFEERKERYKTLRLGLCLKAALYCEEHSLSNVQTLLNLLHTRDNSEFLLDLFSHVMDFESKTGSRLLPAFQPVYEAGPAVWSIDLSKRKVSLLLEVLKLQTQKKPVELRGWSDEESEVRSFLHCLPYISQLRFTPPQLANVSFEEWEWKVKSFHLELCLQTVLCERESVVATVRSLLTLSSVYNESDFLLELYYYVRDNESYIERSLMPALRPVYQSAPEVWSIDLSKTKVSLLPEVLKLQTQKKPVELRGWSDEESEVRSLIQCLPYISQLRFNGLCFFNSRGLFQFLVNLSVAAAVSESAAGESFPELLCSVCTFPFEEIDRCVHYYNGSHQEFLLNLCSRVKDIEIETGRSLLPALKPFYQSGPEDWLLNFTKIKVSIFLEVLKLLNQKKPVEVLIWPDEESEVKSFVQCLPYVSQLRFQEVSAYDDPRGLFEFLLDLSVAAAVSDSATGESFSELLCSLCTFPFEEINKYTYYFNGSHQTLLLDLCSRVKDIEIKPGRSLLSALNKYGHYYYGSHHEFLLDLCSRVMDIEIKTGRSILSALNPFYQSDPGDWFINLRERKASVFLEVLKLLKQKKPVEVLIWPDEENEVRSFLQCLPYISQLRTLNLKQGESSCLHLNHFTSQVLENGS